MGIIYFIFSILYFILAAVNVGYIIKCLARKDHLNSYQWIIWSFMILAYILMGIDDYIFTKNT
jgi:hypothetical protein